MVKNRKSGKRLGKTLTQKLGYDCFKIEEFPNFTTCFLITLTFLFIVFYHYSHPFERKWYTFPNPPIHSKWPTNNHEVQEGFLVYSKSCKIPDLDPYHPSIKHLIKYSNPINCSNYEALTSTNGSELILNAEIASSRGIKKISCCYKAVYRDETGHSDNSYKFSDKCTNVSNRTVIKDEFIKVECKSSNESVFYSNYHSFVHDKADVERARSNTNGKYSVLIIGVDAMSRLNMHRQLKKTSSFLLDNMEAIEMYGFNKVGDNTFPNLIPLLMGYSQEELGKVCWNFDKQNEPLDKCPFLWNKFKWQGYRTFYAEDTPYISSFNYVKRGFYKQPTDYYFRNFMLAFEDDLGRNKPFNCHLCVGSISETEAVLDWTEKFVLHFKNRPYFAFSWINSLTHDELNMGSSGDHLYAKFFKKLHETGALNDTIVIVMGDHGMRWGAIRSTHIGGFEVMLPMLLVVLPQKFQIEYPQKTQMLRQNAHRLVTPFDLHATLNNILHLEGKWHSLNATGVHPDLQDGFVRRARSLFEPVSIDRSCKDAFIDEQWCTCHKSLPISSKSPKIKRLASFVVEKLNIFLKPLRNVCAKLHLQTITQSRMWHPPNSNSHETEMNIYTVTFQTKPGKGLFEATARYNILGKKFELLGTVSRLNLYRNQSTCVHDTFSRMYCYCKNNFR